MEPTAPPHSSQMPQAAREEEVGSLVINGRTVSVAAREDTILLELQGLNLDEASPPRQRRVRPLRVDNDNNNPAVNEDPKDPDLQVFTRKIWNKFNVSYEVTASLISFLPDIHEETLSSPMHIVLKYLKEAPTSSVFTVLLTCLLEAGHDKEFVNAEGITPSLLAEQIDDKLVAELMSHKNPCKATLLELAKAHKRESLLEFLETPECWTRFYDAAPTFVDSITHNREDLYKKVFAFYTIHEQVVHFAFPSTGRTILHGAVSSFLAGNPVGIFECMAIMQLGGNKHAQNTKGESPYSLAKASDNQTLISLFEMEHPTNDEFNRLVQMDPVLPVWLNSSDL